MYWQTYDDMRSPKVEADVPNSCSICCKVVPAGEMWGTQDEEHQKRGWVVCNRCHSLYQSDPLAGWQKAQDRWEADGPCAKLKEVVLSGR